MCNYNAIKSAQLPCSTEIVDEKGCSVRIGQGRCRSGSVNHQSRRHSRLYTRHRLATNAPYANIDVLQPIIMADDSDARPSWPSCLHVQSQKSVAVPSQGPHPSAKLPTEIWRMIFDYATVVPRGSDCSLVQVALFSYIDVLITRTNAYNSSPFDLSVLSNGYSAFLRSLSDNHLTKQTICLVSRKWRAIAQELIFEYLFLQDGFDWHALAEGLEASRGVDEAQGARGAGWYVKRLEICALQWTEKSTHSAARVIRCCPNLRVITIGIMGNPGNSLPQEVVNAVFHSPCACSLRCIEWSSDLGPQTEMVFKSLPQAVNLESLFLCVQQPFEPNNAVIGLSLPKLHTFEIVSVEEDIRGVLKVMATWELPSLRRIVFTGLTGTEALIPFFTAHGPQLSILEFDVLGDNGDPILRLCPLVSELVLHVHWAHVHKFSSNHPGVQRVGLRGLNFRDHRNRDSYVHAALESLKRCFHTILVLGRFPSLQLVRLLDFEQSVFGRRSWSTSDVVTWAFWVTRFERLGVRLEDHEGQLIKVDFRKMNVQLPEDIKPSRYRIR